MSVLRAPDGLISFQCDECGEQFDSGSVDFIDAIMLLRDAGWNYSKDVDGVWWHHCSDACAA